jgi:EAL domain-containing protein (putative c-di-GMP-specific phosphodiesterase class I)
MVFSSDMVGQNESNRDLSYELKRALDEDQLEIYYQPKYDLKSGKFFGAEALIRWKHPIRGVLPPSLFIPFAENSGKIIDIDRYVFRHVCQDIQKWENADNRLLKISVNLSRKSVYDPGLLDYFKATMDEYKVNPLLIEIELTESVAARDTIYVAALLKKFKAMGLSTAIDDFGVGYSSFSSLKKIPFDTLKIDKGFIDDIEIDKKARDMVQCVIDLGHSLEMSVIAEGVQSEAQVGILRKMGLDSIQGFFYSKPLPNYDYVKFLGDNPYEKKTKERRAKA